MLTCPYCKKQLANAVPFCTYCGKEIMFACPHCKAYVDARMFVCPNCGRSRDEPTTSRLAESEAISPVLASQTRPRTLASKIMQQYYQPFFQVTDSGPMIGAFLFGAVVNDRIIAAAMTYAAMAQLFAEGFCSFTPVSPSGVERFFYPAPDKRWDGQIDSLETLLFRHSGDNADKVVEAALETLYEVQYETVAPTVGDKLTTFVAGRAMGINPLSGMIIADRTQGYKQEVYDYEVVPRLHILVSECPMPQPADLNAACARVYDMLLRFYQYDPEGSHWLAKSIAGLMIVK